MKDTLFKYCTILSKEPYYTVKRALLHCQKSPTILSKEPYYSQL
jgi:hypothetical protein